MARASRSALGAASTATPLSVSSRSNRSRSAAQFAVSSAEETANWAAERDRLDLELTLRGVAVLAAPSADLEARAIALAARDALVRIKTVGIVTRDQMLARRVAVELARHGIVVDDPAGTPLFQSGAGRLARQ